MSVLWDVRLKRFHCIIKLANKHALIANTENILKIGPNWTDGMAKGNGILQLKISPLKFKVNYSLVLDTMDTAVYLLSANEENA